MFEPPTKTEEAWMQLIESLADYVERRHHVKDFRKDQMRKHLARRMIKLTGSSNE